MLTRPAGAVVLDSYLEDFSNVADGATINNVDRWQVFHGDPNNAIAQSSVTPYGSGRALKLASVLNTTDIQRPYPYGNYTPTWVSFQVYAAPAAQTPTAPTTGIAAVCFDYTGKLLAANGKQWLDTGQTYALNKWYNVMLKLNFTSHTYDLYFFDTAVPSPLFVPAQRDLKFIDNTINSLSSLKFFGAYSASSSGNIYLDNISVLYIDRLWVITPPQKLISGQPSGPITVQLQDCNSAPQTAVYDVTLDLKSTSPRGQFSLQQSPWMPEGQVVMPKNAQQLTFYYKDAQVGRPLLTVEEYPERGWTNASIEFQIVDKLANFKVEALTPQVAGQPFQLEVIAIDEAGNVNEAYSGTVELAVTYVRPASGRYNLSQDSLTGFARGKAKAVLDYPDCGVITITAIDREDATKSGTSTNIEFVPAGFDLTLPDGNLVIAKEFELRVAAKNTNNRLTPNYLGPAGLLPVAVEPAEIGDGKLLPAVLRAEDFQNGAASVNASYDLYGTIKLRAEDAALRERYGESRRVNFYPKRAMVLVIPPGGGRDFFYTGEPFEVRVRIEDEAGRAVRNYPGAVVFTSAAGLVLPERYTFVPADKGEQRFNAGSNQPGVYTVQMRTAEGLVGESAQFTVRDATIEVVDTTAPVGSGEVVVRLVDDLGRVVSGESELVVPVRLREEFGNGSASTGVSELRFREGMATLPVFDSEPEVVTVVPSALYKLKIKEGIITFGQVGRAGISTLLWREVKTKT